jgi:hypothetical protein
LTTVHRIGYCDTPAPAQNVLLMSLGYGSTQGAYFSPSWTAFQADRGRDFSVIVDGVSN